MADPKSLRQKEAIPGFVGRTGEVVSEQVPAGSSINNFQTPHPKVPVRSDLSLEAVRKDIKTAKAPDYNALLPGAIGIPI